MIIIVANPEGAEGAVGSCSVTAAVCGTTLSLPNPYALKALLDLIPYRNWLTLSSSSPILKALQTLLDFPLSITGYMSSPSVADRWTVSNHQFCFSVAGGQQTSIDDLRHLHCFHANCSISAECCYFPCLLPILDFLSMDAWRIAVLRVFSSNFHILLNSGSVKWREKDVFFFRFSSRLVRFSSDLSCDFVSSGFYIRGRM